MDERTTPTDPAVRVYGWRWGPDESRRPGLPWIGIFLVIFGGILLVDQVLPDYRRIGSATLLAAGLASLLVWVLRRGTIALYAGGLPDGACPAGDDRGSPGKRSWAWLGHAVLRVGVSVHRRRPRLAQRRCRLASL